MQRQAVWCGGNSKEKLNKFKITRWTSGRNEEFMGGFAIGYPPTINYCPSCGRDNITANDHWTANGKVVCHNPQCGVVCIVIEIEDESKKESEDES